MKGGKFEFMFSLRLLQHESSGMALSCLVKTCLNNCMGCGLK